MGQVPGKPPEAKQQHCPLSKPHAEPQSGEADCPTLEITKGSAPQNLQVPFLQWATLLRQAAKADLPNAQKRTQGGCQIEETKKYGPNERTEQNLRKRAK